MRNVFLPFRFKFLKEYRSRPINYLDIGCGSHSPTITKKWFPLWNYYGVDRENYNNDEGDYEVMERFYRIDLSQESLDPIPNHYFDVVVMSHVIEHLPNGLDVIQNVSKKLKGG